MSLADLVRSKLANLAAFLAETLPEGAGLHAEIARLKGLPVPAVMAWARAELGPVAGDLAGYAARLCESRGVDMAGIPEEARARFVRSLEFLLAASERL